MHIIKGNYIKTQSSSVTDLCNTLKLMTIKTSQFLKQQIVAFNLEKKNLELCRIIDTNLFCFSGSGAYTHWPFL